MLARRCWPYLLLWTSWQEVQPTPRLPSGRSTRMGPDRCSGLRHPSMRAPGGPAAQARVGDAHGVVVGQVAQRGQPSSGRRRWRWRHRGRTGTVCWSGPAPRTEPRSARPCRRTPQTPPRRIPGRPAGRGNPHTACRRGPHGPRPPAVAAGTGTATPPAIPSSSRPPPRSHPPPSLLAARGPARGFSFVIGQMGVRLAYAAGRAGQSPVRPHGRRRVSRNQGQVMSSGSSRTCWVCRCPPSHHLQHLRQPYPPTHSLTGTSVIRL